MRTLPRSAVHLVSTALVAIACGGGGDSELGSTGRAGDVSSGSSGFAGSGDSGTSGPSDGTCAAVTAPTQKAKVDIIFVIDSSSSMNQEMVQIKQNVNKFASKILGVGLDLHVVFIAKKADSPTEKGNVLCVPEPLAGPSCADKGTTFKHVPVTVSSRDSFERVLETYDHEQARIAWKDMLRVDATKIFVEVTDDESAMSSTRFDQRLLAKQPAGMFGTTQARKYVWHSIISKPFADQVPSTNICTGAAGTSVQYQELSKLTGGLVDEVCKKDYSSVLDNIAKDVVDKLGCELAYPKAEAADPTKVVVQLTPNGQPGKALAQITDAGKCGQAADGWYYDDNASPTKIILCPATCTAANATPGSKIDALVGCRGAAPR